MKRIIIYIVLLYSCFGSAQHVNDELLRIPVAFHIISGPKDLYSQNDISDDVLKKIINQINSNFNTTDVSKIYFDFQDDVAKSNIEFYIPEQNEECYDFITWHTSNKKDFVKGSNEPFNIIGDSFIDKDRVINICIAKTLTTEKWYLSDKSSLAYWNTNFDGIVIHPTMFFWDYNNLEHQNSTLTIPDLSMATFILTHELGHALSLFHIWGTFPLCMPTDGDGINDTPAQRYWNNAFDRDRFDRKLRSWKKLQVQCDNPNKTSNYQNFMDYSMGLPNGVGMFTKGQVAKMRNYIKTHKPKYLTSFNCNQENFIINDDFLIGHWRDKKDGSLYAFRSDKKYTLKRNAYEIANPNENQTWSLNRELLILKRYQTTFEYKVKIISNEKIELYFPNGKLSSILIRRDSTKTSTPNGNVKKLNNRTKNQQQQKKKGVTLKNFLKD